MQNNINKLASEMVGDGKLPNKFFVTLGNNTFHITKDFNEAYELWKALPASVESSLEDRIYGVICCIENVESKLQKYDNSEDFLQIFKNLYN